MKAYKKNIEKKIFLSKIPNQEAVTKIQTSLIEYAKNKGTLATGFFTVSAMAKSHGLAYISIPVKSAPGPCSYTCLLPLGHCP